MQSGTTGINTIRIYNPVKQGMDHDPQGVFIRTWLPELATVPVVHLHEPWRMDSLTQVRAGCILAEHYPLPIVDPTAAARQAREKIWARRQERGFAELADEIQNRHGSRRSGLPPSGRRPRRRRSPVVSGQQQLELPLPMDQP